MILRAMGGTEQAVYELYKRLPNPRPYSISVSDVNKKADILWMHQSYDQPCVQNLKYTQHQFHKIIYISAWQAEMFEKYLTIDPNKRRVIGNGINPFTEYKKPKDCINLFYSSTPFRGLDVLIEAFKDLNIDNVYLHVFSSMKIYDRDDSDYQYLYAQIRRTPNTRYYGAVAPPFLHNWIARYGHIMAYPCTWEETYCLAAHEAMSGNALIVTPDIGALRETCPTALFYDGTGDKHILINKCRNHLRDAILNYEPYSQRILIDQKNYADKLNWGFRSREWLKLFKLMDME